jgi:hypothetical protein
MLLTSKSKHLEYAVETVKANSSGSLEKYYNGEAISRMVLSIIDTNKRKNREDITWPKEKNTILVTK